MIYLADVAPSHAPIRLPRACGMVAAWCPLIVLHYAAKAWVVRLPSFSPKPAVTRAVAVSASACLARRRTSTCQGCGMVSVYSVVMLGVGCRGTLARLVGLCVCAGLSGPACGDQGDWDSHRDLRPKKLAVAEGNRGAPKPKENSCQSAVPSPCICTWYYIPRPLGPREDGGHVPYKSEMS